jgi:hypothetical protein
MLVHIADSCQGKGGGAGASSFLRSRETTVEREATGLIPVISRSLIRIPAISDISAASCLQR